MFKKYKIEILHMVEIYNYKKRKRKNSKMEQEFCVILEMHFLS